MDIRVEGEKVKFGITGIKVRNFGGEDVGVSVGGLDGVIDAELASVGGVIDKKGTDRGLIGPHKNHLKANDRLGGWYF